jgi:DNA-binding NtrC family response regulator
VEVVDVINFIAHSNPAKEALKTANLLKTFSVNILITGEVGVGKKTLAQYISPSANILNALQIDNFYNNFENFKNSSQIIIEDFHKIPNFQNLKKFIEKKELQIIATSTVSLNSKIMDNFFNITLNIPSLSSKERKLDIEPLIKKFLTEAEDFFKFNIEIDKIEISKIDKRYINLEQNGNSLKKSIFSYYFFSQMNDKEIMILLEDYFFKNFEESDNYKKFLSIYEKSLIKAGLKKYKSQLQLSKVLGLNRNTLRKKINESNLLEEETEINE